MTDKFDDIVDNLKQPSHWVRLPFMLAFGFVLYLIFVPVVLVVMAAQILFALLTGESNRNLRSLGSVVQQYVSQIVEYITYNSDTRPYPFADFPMDGFDSEEVAEDDKEKTSASANKQAKSEPTKSPKKAKKSDTEESSSSDKEDTPAPKTAAKKKPAKKKAAVKKKPAKTSSKSTANADASASQNIASDEGATKE
ncbi:MAG: DUF4389 domain-containing protein [Pseudohongiellaceae bacterium]